MCEKEAIMARIKALHDAAEASVQPGEGGYPEQFQFQYTQVGNVWTQVSDVPVAVPIPVHTGVGYVDANVASMMRWGM